MKPLSGQIYSEFYEQANDAIFIIQQNRFVDCNHSAVKMFEYKSKRKILLSHPSQISPPIQPDGNNSFQKAEEMMELCIQNGQHRFDWLYKKHTGEHFWVEVVLTFLKIENKEYIHAACRDIQERKHLELTHAKRDNEITHYMLQNEQLKFVIDNFMIVSKTDEKGIITFANQAFCDISGYSLQELIGSNHNIIRHPDMPTTVFKELWQQISNGKTWHGTIKNKKKNGQEYFVKTTIIPIFDINEQIIEYVSIREDITILIKERDIAIEHKQEKEMLLSKISHELRTPLNGIQGFSDLLIETSQCANAKIYGELISKESSTLLRLINELLDAAKLNSEHFILNPSPNNLYLFLAYEVKFFALMLSEKLLTFDIHIDNDLPEWILCDILRLKQVIHNLISNAIKFTPAGGRIGFHVHQTSSGLEFRVTDNGIGITTSDQEKIFEAFKQADNAYATKGTGLGLHIASAILSKMDSSLELQSELGKGSAFYFTLNPQELNDQQTLADRLKEIDLDITHLNKDMFDIRSFQKAHLSEAKDLQSNRKQIMLLNELGDMPADSTAKKIPYILSSSDTKVSDTSVIATGINNNLLLYEILFNITSINPINVIPKENYPFNVLVVEDYETNQLLLQTILESFGVNVKVANDVQEALYIYKQHEIDLILTDINLPNIDGIEMAKLFLLQDVNIPIYALTADTSITQSDYFTEILHKPLDRHKIRDILKQLHDTTVSLNAEPLDLKSLAHQLSLSEEILTNLLDTYCKNGLASVSEMKKALQAKSDEILADITHKLKGAASTLMQTHHDHLLSSIMYALSAKRYDEVDIQLKTLETKLKNLHKYLKK